MTFTLSPFVRPHALVPIPDNNRHPGLYGARLAMRELYRIRHGCSPPTGPTSAGIFHTTHTRGTEYGLDRPSTIVRRQGAGGHPAGGVFCHIQVFTSRSGAIPHPSRGMKEFHHE